MCQPDRNLLLVAASASGCGVALAPVGDAGSDGLGSDAEFCPKAGSGTAAATLGPVICLNAMETGGQVNDPLNASAVKLRKFGAVERQQRALVDRSRVDGTLDGSRFPWATVGARMKNGAQRTRVCIALARLIGALLRNGR